MKRMVMAAILIPTVAAHVTGLSVSKPKLRDSSEQHPHPTPQAPQPHIHTCGASPDGCSAMPICIECRYPVKTLYTEYSKADDRALGKGVRLTQCPRCKKFADKYVEHDFVVLFIDLVLIKPQVRHRMYITRGTEADSAGVPPSPLQPPRPRRRQIRRTPPLHPKRHTC